VLCLLVENGFKILGCWLLETGLKSCGVLVGRASGEVFWGAGL
jgi:hypothetical protein